MGKTRGRRYLAPIALAGVFGLVLTGCAEGGSDTPGASGSAGGTVRISGGITGSEADLLQQSFDGFTKDTGIEVVYTGDKGFEGNIVTKVTGGDAPDLAIVPQPGLLKTLIGTGDVVKAPSAVDKAVDENWSPDWKAYGTVDGTFYAAPMPRSTGREQFDAAYVDRLAAARGLALPGLPDVAATLTELTATIIARAVLDLAPERVVLTGGGIHNPSLRERLEELLTGCEIVTAESVGLPADAKEAVLMALIGWMSAEQVPGTLARADGSAVTGASEAALLGSLTPPGRMPAPQRPGSPVRHLLIATPGDP